MNRNSLLFILLLATMSSLVGATDANASILPMGSITARHVNAPATACNNCKVWQEWDGGSAGLYTASVVQGGTTCNSGCTRIEVGAWGKHNDGSYSNVGIAYTTNNVNYYYYATRDTANNYTLNPVALVPGTDWARTVAYQLDTFGYSSDDALICGPSLCQDYLTGLAPTLYFALQVGTRLWLPTTGTGTLRNTDFGQNQWEESNGNWHYQFVDGNFYSNYGPPTLQAESWSSYPSTPGSQGGYYQTFCSPDPNFVCR